jgi:RNA polymerase sigma-70 factor (ECF subfamily)
VEPAVLEELASAMTAGDTDGIRALLLPDVELVIDSGAPSPASTGEGAPADESRGRDATVIALSALVAPETSTLLSSINGVPGLLLCRDDVVEGVVTAEIHDRLLSRIWVVCNPAKLRHWNR